MLKKNLKLITILLIALLVFSTTFVFADEEPISDDPQAPVETIDDYDEDDVDPDMTTDTQKDLKQSDVYLTEDEITIDYVVDGNLFVIANKVTINSEIGGDAFICAKEVTLGEQGYIFSNLFAVADTVNIKGVVYDTYILANNVNISGYVYRDVKILNKNKVSILGTIGRNAFITGTSDISFIDESNESSNQGVISGNLEYSAKSEANISKDNIGGEIKYSKLESTSSNTVTNIFYSLGSSLAFLAVLWLLIIKLSPKFANKAFELLKTKPLPVIGFGVLGLIAVPVVAFIFLLLGITVNISFVLLALYLVLLAISASITTIALNDFVCNKFKVDKTIGKFGILILVGIVIWAIKLIPYLGTLVSVVMVITGLGILTKNFLTEKNIVKSK